MSTTSIIAFSLPPLSRSIIDTNDLLHGACTRRPYLSFHCGEFAPLPSLLQKWRPTTKHQKIERWCHHALIPRCKANMPSIRLPPTVLGRVLMVEAGVYDIYAHLRASCHQWLICILLQKLELVAAALPSPHATILKIKLPDDTTIK